MTTRWVNRDAVEWVMFEAEVPGEQFPVLVTVAAFADAEGRGSYPARSLIARVARRSLRQVARDLTALMKEGHLIEGDWHLVMHIRSDRRPKVYDLPDRYRMWLSRRVTLSPRKAPRGDKNDVHGVTNTTERGDMVSPKEFLKNSGKARADAQPSAAPSPAEENPVVEATPEEAREALSRLKAKLAARKTLPSAEPVGDIPCCRVCGTMLDPDGTCGNCAPAVLLPYLNGGRPT